MDDDLDNEMDDELEEFDDELGSQDNGFFDMTDDDMYEFTEDEYDTDQSGSSVSNSIDSAIDNLVEIASVDAVYGAPIKQGDVLIIPAAEVTAVMGFGMGMGSGQGPAAAGGPQSNQESLTAAQTGSGAGGGGGGSSFARPVAVIISGPDGVRVEPVFDLTKIALAGITAGVFFIGMLAQVGKLRGKIKRFEKELSS